MNTTANRRPTLQDAARTALNISWLFAVALNIGFAARHGLHDARELVFIVAAGLSYGTLLVIPQWLLSRLPWRVTQALSIGLGLLTILILISNYKLYSLYGFHINGFVLNLLMTPGGVASLGADNAFFWSSGALTVLVALLYGALVRYLPLSRWRKGSTLGVGPAATLFLLVASSQAALYAHAFYTGDSRLLGAGDRIFLFQPVYANSTLADLGIEETLAANTIRDPASGGFSYPLAPIEYRATEREPFNIVILVAESWRWDMLDPEIMPETWAFAKTASHFTNHYSGGNGTRMGVFSLFTGLHGAYWFEFLHNRHSPVLMDALIDQGYAIKAFTSAAFTYPEFDKTLFSRLEGDQLQEFDDGYSWQRDQKNITDLLAFVAEQAEQEGPFFTFMFLESPHAKYDFPPENVIREDYLEVFDYNRVDIGEQIHRIKNRYINSCNHLDAQISRVIGYLRDSGQLDNTVVIITGDHGEEFMEKGRWGHNSTFAEEQIKVPLIIHNPFAERLSVNTMTSHLDMPATLLTLMGVENPPSDYSFGSDLFAEDRQERTNLIVADWHGLGIVTERAKINLSRKPSLTHQRITSRDDGPLPGKGLSELERSVLKEVMSDINRFYR